MGVVRRYIGFLIILLTPTPLVLAFFVAACYFFVHFLIVFPPRSYHTIYSVV